MKQRIAVLIGLSVLAIAILSAVARVPDDGLLAVRPDSGVAGNFGTWVVTWRAGDEGIATGGGIRVELPDAWHAGMRNAANSLQATRPTADHYISARSSRADVKLETIVEKQTDELIVKRPAKSLDGRSGRYVFVVRVRVAAGRLRAGDTISVVYGDTSQGSRGMRAGIISTPPQPVLVAVDAAGTGKFELSAQRPTIELRSGPAAELLLYAPSDAVAGKPAKLRLAVVDANSNPVRDFQSKIELQAVDGAARFTQPSHVEMKGAWTTVEFTPLATGIVRMSAAALDGLLQAHSNPVRVHAKAPERSVYWGDLHSHSEFSWDAVGTQSFEYARRISGLDFYTLTDHSSDEDGGLTQKVWERYNALTDRYYVPGKFATLHAYEASFGEPYGHHNVYFRSTPGPLLAPGPKVGLPQLWKALTAGQALTIPHHTGKWIPIRWDIHDPEFRRNFEIYSAHGLSEAYDPSHPLSFEHSDFTSPSVSLKGPQFAEDAWARGLMLSTVSGSDDHRAQPGKPNFGLTAVNATGLTREEVFDALYQRRTYSTTGARILLDFSINGQPMGQTVASSGPPQLEIEAHGTDVIDEVQVLRYSEPDRNFVVIFSIRPESLDFTWRNVDPGFREDSIYYMRLRQRGEIRGRVVMAWSSPIWVKLARPTAARQK